jgi:hypothetical protein
VTVPGAVNRVVVKATGSDGKGRAVKVIFSDPNGITYDSVVTQMTGLGSVRLLMPESGTVKATAVIDSMPAEAQLAVVGQEFYFLAPETVDGNKVRIRIKTPDRSSGATRWPLHLAVITPGRVNFYRQITGPVPDAILEVDPVGAVTGICEALLYDNGGTLLSSRLFMTDASDAYGRSAALLSASQVEDSVRISLPDGTHHVSISVACDDGNTPDMNVWSLLEPWLTASAINDPFLQPFLQGREPLNDDLLIALGERDTPGITGTPERVVAETRGLAVEGTATDLKTLRPVSNMLFFINIPGKSCLLQYARSNEAGNFTFIIPARTGTGEIVIYPQDTAANFILKVTSPFSLDFLPLYHTTVRTPVMADAAVLRMSLNRQVMRIYDIPDIDTLPHYLDPSAREHFYKSSSQHLLLSDYIPLPNMEEIFFELVPNVELTKNRDRYSFRMQDPQTGKEIKDSPLMFIDGTLTTDAETIAGLPPDRVESVDVILRRYRTGGLLLPPLISVVTTKGNFRLQKLPLSALRINYLFTNLPVEFKPFAGVSSRRIPVYGNTLLWSAGEPGSGSNRADFRIPVPDYDDPLRLSVLILGEGPYPVSFSESINLYNR